MTPPVTVVVASFRAPELLSACLDSLERARAPLDTPVVVARQGGYHDVAHLADGRPWLRWVAAAPDADVPHLRGIGMDAVEEGWAAVLEDHCVADPAWLTTLMEEAVESDDVLGGAMGNARPGALNWGAFFSEYGFFTAGLEVAGVPLLTGANVAYGPRVRAEVGRRARGGAWEDVIHTELAHAGRSLRFVGAARVLQNDSYRFGAFCRDRYDHAVSYARTRLTENPGTSRALRIASAPLLPGVLTARVGRAALREHPLAFVRALPFTVAFLASWATGEAVGYLRGPTE